MQRRIASLMDKRAYNSQWLTNDFNLSQSVGMGGAQMAANPQRQAMLAELPKIDDEISKLTARIEELKQQSFDKAKEMILGAPERHREAEKKYYEEQAKAAKELADKSIQKAKEFATHVKDAMETVRSVFTNASDNPFVKIFNDGELAIERVKKATAGLGQELQKTLLELVKNLTAARAFGEALDHKLKATELRSDARQFQQGFRDGGFASGVDEFQQNFVLTQRAQQAFRSRFGQSGPNSVGGFQLSDSDRDRFKGAFVQDFLNKEKNKGFQARLDEQLQLLGKTGTTASSYAPATLNPNILAGESLLGVTDPNVLAQKAFTIQGTITKAAAAEPVNDAKQAEIDRRIIALTKGLDPARLSPQQNEVVAKANIREAEREEKKKTEADELIKKQINAMDKLATALKNALVTVRVLNEAKNRAEVTQTPSREDVNDYYGKPNE